MSPAKHKSTGKGRKQSPGQSSNGGLCASAYNPVFGTFHPIETVAPDLGTPNPNARFRSVGDSGDHMGLNGEGAEYDSVSNSGSSGESEDQLHANGKEKQGCGRLGTPPGLVGGVDKREKIRGKNERKHQRQKERRAGELRDRCIGYLMSRKLETLAQQLVAMGFNHEKATLALILNEGNVEQSVAWLIEGGKGQMKEDYNLDGNLKIDISKELTWITEIESKCNHTRSEIERAIVSCEGDLDRAFQWLQNHCRSTSPAKAQKQNVSVSERHETGNGKEQPLLPVPASPVTSGPLETNNNALLQVVLPSGSGDKDLSSRKGRLQPNPFNISHRSHQGSVKEIHSSGSLSELSMNWQRPSFLTDNRGANYKRQAESFPILSHNYVTSVHFAANSRSDSGPPNCIKTVEVKSPNSISMESAILQRSSQGPSASTAPNTTMSVCSASPPALILSSGWNSNVIGPCSSPSALCVNTASGDLSLQVGAASKQQNLSKCVADLQGHYHPLFSTRLDTVAASLTACRSGPVVPDTSVAASSLLSPSSHSRGFSFMSSGSSNGWGSGVYGPSVDWSTGSTASFDYNNIDWSMAASPSSSLTVGGVWDISNNLASLKMSGQMTSESEVHTDKNAYDVWFGSNQKASTTMNGLQGQSHTECVNGEHEWTSPFTGKNLVNLCHQAVPSHLL